MAKRKPKRQLKKLVLIVCEGETEKAYFQCIIGRYRLRGVDVVSKEDVGGNAPKNLLNYAKAEGVNYDQIFCVFDKDEHASYAETVNALKNYKELPIKVITSIPCFEYWLLIHFQHTSAPYMKTGTKTAANCCEDKLKKVLPEYKKGRGSMREIFSKLFDKLETAILHAGNNQRQSKSSDYKNPYTNVHELVNYLLDMRL